ncbi:hypothetical protein A4X09_0g2730 [Tilletia walkeri]|uniref:Cysteine dioxygenase n=1 Tax=Tilletia walkeri TaxID=117179 RepID=A0A8X7NAC2_9BASI|nr:hypothetical protein A4X09_0g2730 [Tilletia walkeri]
MVLPPRITLHKFTVPLGDNEREGLDSDGPSEATFSVKGQGTISVKPTPIDTTELTIILSNNLNPNAGSVGLTVNSSKAVLWVREANTADQKILKASAEPAHVLDAPDKNQPYWLSFDANNKRFRYGKGEMMRINMMFEASWASLKKDDPQQNPLIELYKSLNQVDIRGTNDHQMECLRTAVNVTPAPHLRRPELITLENIAKNEFTVASDLPFACFQLFNNVAGPDITLDTKDFPDFSKAIQHSIVTEGALCNMKLKTKEKDFGYLRVTLDANAGESPGAPYVCEIWPAGNGSPIHDHSKANAVIKALHGNIKVSWFSGLAVGINEPWGHATITKNEVTFLTPHHYQIHQLHNDDPVEFAATIQCYRYNADDDIHYEYFDYINPEKKEKEHFEPDSDFDFIEFKKAIKAEWEAVPDKDKVAVAGPKTLANGTVAPMDE